MNYMGWTTYRKRLDHDNFTKIENTNVFITNAFYQQQNMESRNGSLVKRTSGKLQIYRLMEKKTLNIALEDRKICKRIRRQKYTA